MWKLLFLVAAFAVSLSPVDARQPPAMKDRVEKRDSGELRRDIERISREIYRERSDFASSRPSFAAGTAAKKR
jgi:hypothetical protein